MANAPETEIRETEAELIAMAQNAVSRCNWVVGECAAKWTQKYAKGRTDADFAAVVGLSPDQVYQRRRVWETFGDVADSYPSLKWSHFYVALNWDDAPECLQWAMENEATVAEMRAWRRLQHGEDLTTDAEDEEIPFLADGPIRIVSNEPTAVRDPDEFASTGQSAGRSEGDVRARDSERVTVAGVARESEPQESDYAPYRQGAASPGPRDDGADAAAADRPEPSVEQLVKRMTTSLERCNQVLTPEFCQDFRKLPEKLQKRFLKAAGEFSSKAAGLM